MVHLKKNYRDAVVTSYWRKFKGQKINQQLCSISTPSRREQMSKINAKRQIQILENCNYAVELGKKLNFVLVNIDGSDIMTGNRTLTLGLGNNIFFNWSMGHKQCHQLGNMFQVLGSIRANI